MKTKKFFAALPFMLALAFTSSAQNVDQFQIPDFPEMIDFQYSQVMDIPDLNQTDFTIPNIPGVNESNPLPTSTSSIRVTTVKFVDGQMATEQNANYTTFGMNETHSSASLGPGSGVFSLGPLGTGGSFTSYQATTLPLEYGSSYAVSEIMDANVGTSCVATTSQTYKPFALMGYSVGNTLAEAKNAAINSSAPNLTNLQTNKYIIVWNDNCATTNSGTGYGSLKVDSIESLSNSGIANDTFENGFKYIFNITAPTGERALYMKFSDWNTQNSSGKILAANNIRISSPQATSTLPIIITAANIYTAQPLIINSDLDPNLPGNQIKVLVETKIPLKTMNGSYTATYGVKTQ